jgi:membrane fusion protein, multidrug efflux system
MAGNYSGRSIFIVIALAFLGVALCTGGCRKTERIERASVPLVEVTDVIRQDVPIYTEWTASTDGLVNATIRAQVQGYLVRQTYRDGDIVRKGQVLFEIDPRSFRAALDQAQGQLAQARARWDNAKANLERIKPLVEQRAVSLKDLDDAVGNEQASQAAVASAQASVDKARLDLDFTKILSPITGIAGIARAQIGNLVGPGSIEELTMVSTVDPIKVYIPMTEQEFLQNVEKSRDRAEGMELRLILANGMVHPQKGTFAFADRQVDLKTGTIKVAVLFPNPGNALRPGQFAKVRARTMVRKGALLVPQRAVAELQGRYQVAVVDRQNKVSIRPVRAAERIGNLWVIDEGLNAGEQVVAEGLQKVRQGTIVTTKPFETRADAGTRDESTASGNGTARSKAEPVTEGTAHR